MEKECTFCKLYRIRNGILYENKHFYARYDRYPISPGHLEIIPIKHIASILDLNNDEWICLQDTLKEVINKMKNTDQKELYKGIIKEHIDDNSVWFCNKMLRQEGLEQLFNDFNIGINDGTLAGRTIDHLHIHIIPRYKGDVLKPEGGVRNIIPGMKEY